MTNTMDAFDTFLDATLRTRTAPAPPVGLEQRLLAHLANADAPLFTTFDRVETPRSSRSLAGALLAHTAVFLIILAVAAKGIRTNPPARVAIVTEILSAPPLIPKLDKVGGGGGQTGPTPVTVGHLPKFAVRQIVPPMAPPMIAPRLPVEPSVVVQPDLKMADNRVPDLGVPTSSLKGLSMGNGKGSGIGPGDGSGIGPGSGSGIGGGPLHAGGIVSPTLLYSVEAEFSEEARRAKFSGDVQVYLWVDEHGNPSHVRVARGVGMGLDEKAVEAVRQYRFKPAMLNGKPVKVDMYVTVDFRIF